MSEAGFQRLDTWLWCARFRRGREDCAALVEAGAVRINRQPTGKAHARVRPGDVLTLALPHKVVVVRILQLAERRGPPAAALALYEELE